MTDESVGGVHCVVFHMRLRNYLKTTWWVLKLVMASQFRVKVGRTGVKKPRVLPDRTLTENPTRVLCRCEPKTEAQGNSQAPGKGKPLSIDTHSYYRLLPQLNGPGDMSLLNKNMRMGE